MVMGLQTEDLAPLLTCHICFKIQRNPTSIIECNHIFCKKCIIKRFTEERLNSCPICNTDLGCFPLDKLCPDHSLQSVTIQLLLSIKKNTKEPDVSARDAKETVTAKAEDEEPEMPARRNNRSLSSFVNTPNVSCETLPIGKRKPVPKKFPSFISNEVLAYVVEDRQESSKSAITRKNACNRKQLNNSQLSNQQVSSKDTSSNVLDQNCLAKAVDTTKSINCSSQGIVFSAQAVVGKVEDRPENLTSPILRKNARNRKQLNISQPSKQQVSRKDAGVWDLNRLAEAVDTTNGSKSRSQGIVFKTPPSNYENTSNNIILDDDDDDEKEEEEDPNPALVSPTSVKQKRKAQGGQRAVAPSEGVRISAQAVVDANGSENIQMNCIWLSLVATYRQDVGPPLPQIPCCYLRIKDIHSPVSLIKKYIVRKLNLESEDEVEIELLGRPLPSNMELYMLVDIWGQTVQERISTSVGSSARDLVMVLSYSRKA